MNQDEIAQLRLHGRTFLEIVQELLARVELLEHFSNQQSILVDTLGEIMEELKKQEH